MKLTLNVLLLLSISLSCTNKFSLQENDDCIGYFEDLMSNWYKNENDIYGFKKNGEYWDAKTYNLVLNENCLIGLNKEKIISLLGQPTKQFVYRQKESILDVFVFCTDLFCIESFGLSAGHNIRFIFNENEELKSIQSSPVVSQGIKMKQ